METSLTLKLAFASDDRLRVNQHFGAATAFVIYSVSLQGASVSGFGEFPEEAMDGNENKLAAKVDFLRGCDAVFVRAIGASAIKQLLAESVQPVRVDTSDTIADLLKETMTALAEGGIPWVERALAAKEKARCPDRFSQMAAEGWDAG
jgi:nitrogen fixation protein NifX